MRYRILNAESLNFSEKAKSILASVADVDYYENLDANKIKRIISRYDGLMVRLKTYIGPEIIDRANRMLFIASSTTGLDHIDVEFAKRRSIEVISLFGEKEFLEKVFATAEYTMALMLTVVRNIPYSFDDVKKYRWNRNKFIGSELNGKTLGIVGYGRIGKMVGKYAHAFGMEVMAHDSKKTIREKNIRQVSLDTLLKSADIISIHLPLNDETRGIFNKSKFRKMKKGIYLINTSRAPIINESALLWALKQGFVKGAAVDVIEGERDIKIGRIPLIEYAKSNDNLVITPHLGGATFESMKKTEIFIARNIVSFLKFQNAIRGKR